MRNFQRRPEIVIVGGGFAGLHAAQRLPARAFSVTLIDSRSHFEWTPNIHELLSGLKQGHQLKTRLQPLVEQLGHRFIREQVAQIDATEAVLEGGTRIPFDAAIVACGGRSADFGVAGVRDYAYPLKTVADGEAIVARLQDELGQRSKLTISVVGGGLSGIEVLGELLRNHDPAQGTRYQMIDAASHLLHGAPRKLDSMIRRRTRGLPVSFHLGRTVRCVGEKTIDLDDGQTLTSNITIWTAGQYPQHLLHASSLAEAREAWGSVNAHLQSTTQPNVFIVGDAAELPFLVEKQAFHAIEMGKLAARNLRRYLDGKTLLKFRPRPIPRLISFGNHQTFMATGTFALANPLMSLGKEAVYALGMLQIAPPIHPPGLRQGTKVLGSGLQRVSRMLDGGLNIPRARPVEI